MFSSHLLNLNGPVPTGLFEKESPRFSTTSCGTTEQYFIVKISINEPNSLLSFISKIESLIALKLSTLFITQDPGDAIFSSIILLKLYSKSNALTFLVLFLKNSDS